MGGPRETLLVVSQPSWPSSSHTFDLGVACLVWRMTRAMRPRRHSADHKQLSVGGEHEQQLWYQEVRGREERAGASPRSMSSALGRWE